MTTKAITQQFTAMIKMAMAMGKESLWALKPGTNSSSCSVRGVLVEFGMQFCVVKQLAEDIVQHCDFTLHTKLWKIKKEAQSLNRVKTNLNKNSLTPSCTPEQLVH